VNPAGTDSSQLVAPRGLFAKRLVDVILSGSALLTLSVPLAAVALAIKLDSPGPVIFRQTRVGKDGNFFEILKFRTMRQGTPQVATDLMLKMEQSPITKVGNLLRKSSVDELPQLINVLRGDMSLVGPRPALYNQTELTARRQAAGALRMLPGITGWAQVNGRDELADDVKVEYDKWYCENWSLMLDLRIIYRTIAAVLNRRGAL
jgi:O-antigen biosynthesis protein WbqP